MCLYTLSAQDSISLTVTVKRGPETGHVKPNNSETGSEREIMAYSGTYAATDTSNIFIDLIGTVAVAAVGFGALIGLVLLYRWFKKKGVAKAI